MESTANLMIFCGIRRKFYKLHGQQKNAMANLERGESSDQGPLNLESTTSSEGSDQGPLNLELTTSSEGSDQGPLNLELTTSSEGSDQGPLNLELTTNCDWLWPGTPQS